MIKKIKLFIALSICMLFIAACTSAENKIEENQGWDHITGVIGMEERPAYLEFDESNRLIVTSVNGNRYSMTISVDNPDEVEFKEFTELSNKEPDESLDKTKIPVQILPDTEIMSDDRGRFLLLTDPTEEYKHGVLGDVIEAKSFTIVDSSDHSPEVQTHSVPADDVIEGTGAIWMDWDGDGTREIVVTLSNSQDGARLALFGEKGERLAEGPSIDMSNRWRHQLTIDAFGMNGELELVEVKTPHIGGIVGYYQWDQAAQKLVQVANISGYSTHDIGSRNLDMFASGDLDGDGQFELILPNQQKSALAILNRTPQGVEEMQQFALNDKLSTNIALSSAIRPFAMAAGTHDGQVRVWIINPSNK